MITGSLGVVSNREDWDFEITVIDKDTSEAIDISAAAEITIAVRRQGNGTTAEMTATIGDGVTLSATTGVFDLHFAESSVSSLIAGTYDVGMVVDVNSAVKQLFVGTIAVLDGVVE